MNEPPQFDGRPLDLVLDEMMTNTPTFDWSKMGDVDFLIVIMTVSHSGEMVIRHVLHKLERNLKNYNEPYVSLQAIIILEILTGTYVQILHELSIDNLLEALIGLSKTSIYENVRRKILSLLKNWAEESILIIKDKLEEEGVQFRTDSFERQTVSYTRCPKCRKSHPNIICAACVQLHCSECSQKSVALPKCGFKEPVRVCDVCFNIYQKPEENASYSSTTTAISLSIDTKAIECPICLDVLKKPIIQCKLGHSMCQNCAVGNITSCPLCRKEITQSRNYIVEMLIENQKTNCIFNTKGCEKTVNLWEKESHEKECKFREVQCEGKKFCKWYCNWTGSYHEIEQHFDEHHAATLKIQPRVKTVLKNNCKLNLNCNFIRFVNYHDGQQFFWYKQRIDRIKKKVFWTVQLIGTQEETVKYFYEITFPHRSGRKLSITDICHNDQSDAEEIFQSGKCIVLSVDTLQTYMNESNDFSCTLSIYNNVEN